LFLLHSLLWLLKMLMWQRNWIFFALAIDEADEGRNWSFLFFALAIDKWSGEVTGGFILCTILSTSTDGGFAAPRGMRIY